ncbi:MAG TPA: hypothetical protein VN541_21190 [Tepidisphaeraceae bacterium]|nr:hypothetical protein [Tepidisphaeraceae bacterium]
MAKAALAANPQSLALAHQAAQRPEIDWRGATPAFNVARQLALLLADGAAQAHSDRDDALAIQRISDLKREADIIDPTFHAVALGLEAQAIETLEQVLPDLVVESDVAATGHASNKARPVAQAMLMKLLQDFLDETRVSEQLRTSVADNLRWTYQRLQTLRSEAFALRPLVDLEAARVLTQQDAYLRAATKLTFADGESFLKGLGLTARLEQQAPPLKSHPLRYSRVVSDPSTWPRGYIIWAHWQVTVERRAAAIAIAIQLYRARNGRWPTTLQALVPEFLPAVPRNPMIPGDKPIEYVIFRGVLPGGHDRPMLRFAVGPSAAASHPIPEPCFGWGYDAEEHDDIQWRDLSRWYPAPAATQPQAMPASP